jgi:hypothetical protein
VAGSHLRVQHVQPLCDGGLGRLSGRRRASPPPKPRLRVLLLLPQRRHRLLQRRVDAPAPPQLLRELRHLRSLARRLLRPTTAAAALPLRSRLLVQGGGSLQRRLRHVQLRVQ